MSKRTPQLYLDDIRSALDHIFAYTKDMSWEAFQEDQRTIDAVVRNFEILGEAASRLSLEVRKEFSDVPWHAIIGLRNKAIHEYFGLELAIIWQTIQEDLPPFKQALEAHLAKQKPSWNQLGRV